MQRNNNGYPQGYTQNYNRGYNNTQGNSNSYPGNSYNNNREFNPQNFNNPKGGKTKSIKDKLTSKKGLAAIGAFSLISGILLVAGGVAYMNQANDEQAGASEMTNMYISAVCENNNQELTGLDYRIARVLSDGTTGPSYGEGSTVPADLNVTLGGTIRVSVQDPAGKWIEQNVPVTQNVQVVFPIQNCGDKPAEHEVTVKALCKTEGNKEIRKHFWVFFEGENGVQHSGTTTTDSAKFTYPKNKTAIAYTKVNGQEIHIPINPDSTNAWDNVWELDNCAEDEGTPETPGGNKEAAGNKVNLRAFCMKDGAREREIKKNFTVFYQDSGNVFYKGTTNTDSAVVKVDPNIVQGKSLNAFIVVGGEEIHLQVKPGSSDRVDNTWELTDCSEDSVGNTGQTPGNPPSSHNKPAPADNSSWTYYWDEECVCTDNKSWKSLRDQPSAQDKGKCQSNTGELQQLCKQIYPGVFEGNVVTYWDEECVKTDNSSVWVNEPKGTDPSVCVGLNNQ